MPQYYSSAKRARDTWALPDVFTTQLTATEVAAQDEELVWEYSKRHEFRLCHMNSRTREAMLDAIVAEEGVKGGWFYYFGVPGCLPDSSFFGPYRTEQAAARAGRKAAREYDAD